MPKIKNHISLLLGIFLFFLSGCSRSGISGQVVDPSDKGIKGVTVKIANSTFSTLTDDEGKYLLDFTPGSFKVMFSKPGHTTQKIELNISQKSLFPAGNIVMYPIPEKEGIYYLDGNQLVALKPYPVKKREWSQSWPLRNFSQYYLKLNSEILANNQTIKHGIVKFIDTSPGIIKLFRLNRSGLIQDYSYSFGDWKYNYDGINKDKLSDKVGEENILIRTVEVKPGFYAWVETVKTLSGYTHPNEKKKAFVFYVPLPENQNALNLDADKVKLYVLLGNLYYDTEQYQKSIEYYQNVLQLKPEMSDVRVDMATMYRKSGQPDKAIEELRRVNKSNPNHAAAYLNLGIILKHDKKDSIGAKKAWQSFLKVNPNNLQAEQVKKMIAELVKKETN